MDEVDEKDARRKHHPDDEALQRRLATGLVRNHDAAEHCGTRGGHRKVDGRRRHLSLSAQSERCAASVRRIYECGRLSAAQNVGQSAQDSEYSLIYVWLV